MTAAALEFRNVDILFGARRPRVLAAALAALDAGRSRGEIAAELRVVVGVAGANLTVRQGEISVLMGLSGSGKSTLLRAANGLNKVTRGEVLVRDGDQVIDVARCDPAQLRRVRRSRVAMVFQQFGLLPWRTIRDNVGLGLELRGMAVGERRKIVDRQLELVGLEQWADRYAHELSGGMQQRVGLARAFATDADILLMDEPFSALDPLIRAKLQDELLALQAQVRKTIVFVSHDLDEALKLGDQVTIMEDGRIVQTGEAEDIVLRPSTGYVAEFVRHMNPLNVLSAHHIMRPIDELAVLAEGVWLDRVCGLTLRLQANRRFHSAEVDGQDCPLATPARPGALSTAALAAPLQTLMALMSESGRPVLLTEEGQVRGVCAPIDIMRALAGPRAHAGSPDGPA
jgi:glycine betaine/proline transport system ATP-binding protein